jgi:transcription-repair coupling factor (superfamily II helicase)
MLESVLTILRDRPALAEGLAAARDGRAVRLEGLSGSHLAAVLTELQSAVERPLAVILPADLDLEVLLVDLRTFHARGRGRGAVVAFPGLEVNPYGSVPPHDDIVRERLQTLDRCLHGAVDVLLAPVRCWVERLQAPGRFREQSLRLSVGDEIDPEELTTRFVDAGYRRVSLVESLGEFAVRGGIVDIFPPTRENPVRLELFGDEIDSLREFNARDQRSMRQLDAIELPPATSRSADDPVELAARESHDGALADYLREPLWVEVEPEVLRRNAEKWSEYLDEHYHQALASGAAAPVPDELVHSADVALPEERDGRVEIRELASGSPDAYNLLGQAAPGYRGRLSELAQTVQRDLETGERVVFALGQRGKAERLAEILRGYDVHVTLVDDAEAPLVPGTCWICTAELSTGFRLPDLRLWVSGDAEVFGRARPVGRRRRFHGDSFQGDFRDLEPDDLVIHEDHGIGRFIGVKTIAVGDSSREFMEIEYRGSARLYLPLEQLYLVQKFRAGEGVGGRIDKLGGSSWSAVKRKVKSSLRDMAGDLLELYAARKAANGYSFGADTPWQREMEDSFEYDETPDQLTCIAEAKADMESKGVMDRLLCGDVGYGKTEVAMRAAFKAVMEGKQVAFLAPTTVLAHQHWRTLQARFAAFPVRVDLLSRFRSTAEQRVTAGAIADGTVDVAVGTHRLLARDIEFKDLGLLVVDEEQRFGVAQKEKLKRLKQEVDVLSMTATPIPRTLQMSLLGVRDLSVIETAPKDRYAIATHVVAFDHEIIADAIHEELGRGGQIFFVHNRIESIYRMARRLEELVPEASFRVAHGRLPKAEMERVMLDFVEGAADVLVTTAIIENGLDIPMANTIIIDRADTFGLAQLYQLRGRVGRSTRRAYAYLIVPPVDTLTTIAKKRLRAIQEFSDLGSGFRLAAMDLEIRGAGSLLGERQHGHIAAVGFEMYARLLEESVNELKGEPMPAAIRAQLKLGVDLQVPADYIDDPIQRLMISKRLASSRTEAQLDQLQNELRDRYGPLPAEVDNLFAYAHLRLSAEALGVVSIERSGDEVVVQLSDGAPIDMAAFVSTIAARDDWTLRPPDRLAVSTTTRSGGGLVADIREVLDALPFAAPAPNAASDAARPEPAG